MTWTFPRRDRRPGRQEPPADRLDPDAVEENLPLVIQGRPAESLEEARVAVALEIMGWRFVYQQSYFGGTDVPGGLRIDFLVLTPVTATPLLVQSRYWHTVRDRRNLDLFQRTRLAAIPNLAEPIEVWDYELQTLQQSIRTLTKVLGRP